MAALIIHVFDFRSGSQTRPWPCFCNILLTQGQEDISFIHSWSRPHKLEKIQLFIQFLKVVSFRFEVQSRARRDPRHVRTVTSEVIKHSGSSEDVPCWVTSTPLAVDSLAVKLKNVIIVQFRKINRVWVMNHSQKSLRPGSDQAFL